MQQASTCVSVYGSRFSFDEVISFVNPECDISSSLTPVASFICVRASDKYKLASLTD